MSHAYTLRTGAQSDFWVKKSHFLGEVQPVPDRQAAQAWVGRLREQHPRATHVCWALLAGGHSAAVDDGEPSGTAGRPMLEVLRHHRLEGVLATVVRYYGGIPLGAGGLVRAYSDAVAQALKLAEKTPLVPTVRVCCRVAYAQESWLRREIETLGASLEQVEHGPQAVRLWVVLPEPGWPQWQSHIDHHGKGRVVWETV